MNTIKWENYKLAWDRINHAKEHGCGIEVIAISESIMNDRLLSFLEGQPNNQISVKTSFYSKIKAMGTYLNAPIGIEITAREGSSHESCSTNDLFREVDNWRVDRNKIIHGIARPESDWTPNNSIEFETLLNKTAKQGENLARMVIKWHGIALAAHRKETCIS
jgi:hypothetical protein